MLIGPHSRCIVTGATSGLGLEVALLLLRNGAEVVVHGRSAASAIGAAERLHEMVPGARISTVHADFGEKAAIDQFLAQLPEGPFNVLVNNAGAAFAEFATNPLGIERTVWINHCAPFLLTKALMPRMAQDGVVATISSAVVGYVSVDHAQGDFTGKDLADGYTQLRAYGVSKLYNLAAMTALARTRDSGPAIIMVDPGGIQTDFARKAGEQAFLEMTLAHWADCVPADEAARQVLAAITSEDLQSGGLYYQGHPIDIPANAHDHAFADRVMRSMD